MPRAPAAGRVRPAVTAERWTRYYSVAGHAAGHAAGRFACPRPMPASTLPTLAAAAHRPFAPAVSAAALLAVAAACGGATEPRERVRTYEVAETRVACVAMFPTECLRVRALPDTAWRAFYAPIDGFAYEPGYRYVLRVGERDVANPPADGSSLAYRLLGIVSKVRGAL